MAKLTIDLKCTSPQYAAGDHTFAKFRDLAQWLLKIKRARSYVGRTLIGLAEHGSDGCAMHGCAFEATSSHKVGYSAKVLARGIGLLKLRIGGDTYNSDLGEAIRYAEMLDELAIYSPEFFKPR